jgi:response regulator RpfG family c-di-GMP phosphodiesterase
MSSQVNGQPNVTVVEDEPLALDVIVRAASAWRFHCQTANTAEQALSLLEQRLTPIVLTDLRMPGRGGVWLVREIQKRWPEVSVIVLTAGHDYDAVSECLSAGAHQYFLKPIKLDELRHALESTMRYYRNQREHDHHRRKLEDVVQKQTQRIRRTFLSAIDSLIRTLEARDSYTSGHSWRVRRYALGLAAQLKLPARMRKHLSLAAKLHDIGKVGLPEGILNKPGPLTAEEYDRVKEHPVIGERILTPIIRSRGVLEIIRGHHERFDGGGYPDGLAGEQIPFLARVLSVADCYDALTSSRAYREKRSPEQALEVIAAGAGTQFDPAIVNAFVAGEIVRDRELASDARTACS